MQHSLKLTFVVFVSLLFIACGGDAGTGSGFNSQGGDGPVDTPDGSPIDSYHRASVVEAYHDWFNAPRPSMNWTGDKANCIAGNTSLAFQERVIDHINYYRAMSGLALVDLNTNNNNYQEAALMMAVNGRLSHAPTEDWECYSSAGRSGASSSNLVLRSTGTSAIDIYMDDWGANNEEVGHRRWIMDPGQRSFAVGDVPGANSLAVWNDLGQDNSIVHYSWPSEGFIPYQVLPNLSNRWLFSMRGASFTNATVKVRNITDNISYTVSTLAIPSDYYRDAAIVFKPQSFSYSRPSKDKVIQVTIDKIRKGGEDISYSYKVIVIDPNS